MMHFRRYLLCTLDDIHCPIGVDRIAHSWVKLHHFDDGTVLVRADFHEGDLRRIQADDRLVMLPGLTGEVDRAHGAFQAKLQAAGVALQPGDRMLNALRKLRDAVGASFEVNHHE